MEYRDHCRLCGESYWNENLFDCERCGTTFCYRCGDCAGPECRRCAEERRRAAADP